MRMIQLVCPVQSDNNCQASERDTTVSSASGCHKMIVLNWSLHKHAGFGKDEDSWARRLKLHIRCMMTTPLMQSHLTKLGNKGNNIGC
eukprot:1305895-Amphidinium_carterae.2